MTENRTRPDAISFLRKQAEEKLASIESDPNVTLSQEATRQILHELQVHQIELEMQNGELRRAMVELDASRERYFDLYDLAPVGYFTLSQQGVILEANLTAANLLCVERAPLVSRPFSRFIFAEDQDVFYKHRNALFGTGAPQTCELRLINKEGTLLWTRLEFALKEVADGLPTCRAVVIDITKRREAEAALERANRALLMLKECDEVLMLAKNETDLLNEICRKIVDVGEASMAWVGFAEDDAKKTVRPVTQIGGDKEYLKIVQVTWADVPEGRGPTGTAIRSRKVDQCLDIATNPRFAPWRRAAIQRGYRSAIALPLIGDKQCLGSLTIYSQRAEGFNGEEVELLERLATDLTFGIIALRNRSEREQLQDELLKISERSKQFISQDLHDGLCQHLTGVAFLSSVLHSRLAARNDEDVKAAREICDLLNTAVSETRNISHGLHPVGPQGEGLMNALSQLAGTVCNLFHLQCTFQCPEPVFIENENISTHLFRITQEAINNARKHGEADKVTIGLRRKPEGLILSIRDNGIGIPPNTVNKFGMGMRIMNHRASEMGATLLVRRAGKQGTMVRCTVPC